jgi:hypothetical protein
MKFDFNPIISILADTFPEVTFYISNKSNVEKKNVVYVSDLLGECGGCDLNEISYLSTKCDVSIGRYSGPHTFTYVKENLMNPDMKFITFSEPSNLYGNDPTKWSNFGVHMYLDKNEHAQFFNVLKYSDNERILEICKIIGE